DTLVSLVLDHPHARIGERLRALDGGVPGAVVDDVDAVDELGDALDRRAAQLLLVVGGNDDRDPLAVEHGLELPGRQAGVRAGVARPGLARPRAGACRPARNVGRAGGRASPTRAG